jgi:uncharacterized protein (DUF488 family)
MPLYTLGHSTRPAEEFIRILRSFELEFVVDIRTVPRSRKNPQYDAAEFQRWLAAAGFRYEHWPELGGLRKPRKDSMNLGWRNESFRGYADYMQSEQFKAAADRLANRTSECRMVIVCAEAVPWRCHRSLVADAVLMRGAPVFDIMGVGSAKPHVMTPFAVVDGCGISYPKVE